MAYVNKNYIFFLMHQLSLCLFFGCADVIIYKYIFFYKYGDSVINHIVVRFLLKEPFPDVYYVDEYFFVLK